VKPFKTMMMKVMVVITLLAFSTIFPALSQQKGAIGVKAGIGLTDEINNLYTASSKIGYQINGFYHIKFTHKLSARLEGGFIQKGFNSQIYPSGTNPAEENYNTTYHYVTFGPDLILTFPNQVKTVYFFGGIRADYFIDYSSSEEFQKHFIDPVAEDFRKFQILINTGTGILLPSGLFIELNGNIDVLNKIKTQRRKDIGPQFFDLYIGLNLGWKMDI